MGATPSKQQDGLKASLSRSISAPVNRNREEDENVNEGSWKSKLFSFSNVQRQGKGSKVSRIVSKLKPVKEDEVEVDFDDHVENPEKSGYVNGFQYTNKDSSQFDNGCLLRRSVTFQPSSESELQSRLVSPRKSFRDKRGELDIKAACGSPKDYTDQGTGLRLLLDSSSSPSSHTQVSLTIGPNMKKSFSSKGSFNSRYSNDLTRRALPRICMDDVSPLEPQWLSASSDLDEPVIPHFDPSLLACFERAVEDVSHSAQPASIRSKLESARFDEGKPKPLKEGSRSLSRMRSLRSRAAVDDIPDDNASQLRTFPFLHRKPSFSKVIALKNDHPNYSSQTYLDKFPKMCPPDCEGKVVLYFTSLRGVRKTFENCCMLRLILKGFQIHVDERDVWMHSKFRQELTEVMGAALSVPRLFILGRYIGGAEDVQLLHEEGILGKLLEDLPVECRQVCKICADVRFIPCTLCRGSCKIVTSLGISERCSECNENGLIMCPLCD